MWTDPAGRRLPTTLISSSTGPEHCDGEDITFLHLSTGASREATQVYVRNPHPDLSGYVTEPYRAARPLPDDAVDTGYPRGDQHRWLSADGQRA